MSRKFKQLEPGDNIYYCSERKKWFISLKNIEVNFPYDTCGEAEVAYGVNLEIEE